MYTLFNLDLKIQTPFFRHPDWNYVSDTVSRTLDNFVKYYQDHSFAVKSNHLLVKLLQSIGTGEALGLNDYLNRVDSLASNLSMALKFTSSINKGNVFNNIFFGPNSNEVIISYSTVYDVKQSYYDWKNIRAVNILRHDRTNLALNLLDGKTNYESEIAVVSIDIPLLALQYRAFRENQHYINSGESEESAMQFVAKYVLPNMAYSYLDWAIYNRMDNYLFDKSNETFNAKTPFYQIDYTSKIDKVLLDQLNRFKNTKLRFDAILKMIPVISETSLFEMAKLTQVAPTLQVIWALVLARIKILKFLFTINRMAQTNENQAQINKILRQAIYYRSNNTLRYGLPLDIFNEVQDTITELERLGYMEKK